MARYNHDRADGPENPCLICQVEDAMEKMQVDSINKIGQLGRWSRTDFITDLIDYIKPRNALILELQAEIKRIKEGDLTPEEFNNLCHNLEKKGRPITREEHKKECDKWRDGLFGPEPVKVSYDLELIKIQVEAAKEIIVYAIGGRSSESTQRAINAASDFLVQFFSPLKIEFDNQITEENLKKALEEFQARGINIQPPTNRG